MAAKPLILRRAIVVIVALLLAGAVGALGAWHYGLFKASTAASRAVSVSSAQASYLAGSGWQAGTAYDNASAVPPDGKWPTAMPLPPAGVPVLSNSCSAGYVTFTFDDGPDVHTLALASELLAEHVQAVFFEIGDKVTENPGITRVLADRGFVIGDHTYNHESMTGASTKTKPLTDSQVRAELTRASDAIVAAGAPKPALWRAPYDDASQRDANIAATLGLRLVMSYGLPAGGNIEDSQDWSGNSPASIAAHVDTGYTLKGYHYPGMRAKSILSFHDGVPETPNTIKAIPIIVAWMNAHHLCATSTVRPNATGGILTQAGTPGAGGGGGA